MSSSHEQPEHSGKLSTERKPQVVVRADKYFVCSACGVLVEVPADVVGQLVIAVDPSPQESQVNQSPAQEEPSLLEPAEEARASLTKSTQAVTVEPSPSPSLPQSHRLLRPKRPKRPKGECFTGELIDGLRVPTANELDRALVWVSFHLKVLDRQGSEINRLKKLLKKRLSQSGPCVRPGQTAETATAQEVFRTGDHQTGSHAHENVTMAPVTKIAKGREPP